MHVAGSGGGPTLSASGLHGPGNIFHDRVINHLAALEYGLNGFNNKTLVKGEPFKSNGLSKKLVTNIKNESFQDILKDAVSKEDLLFLKGQLKTYKKNFTEWYPDNVSNNDEYQDHLDFFDQSLFEVSQKMAVTEDDSGNSAAPLPDNLSKSQFNANQKNLGDRLRITMLHRGILAIRIPLDPLLKTALPNRPIGSSYRNQPLKVSIQSKIRLKMAAFIPDAALRKGLNAPKKKEDEETSTTDEQQPTKPTDTAIQADAQDASEMSGSPEKLLSRKNTGSNQAGGTHKKSEISKIPALSAIKEAADIEEPPSQAPKGKEQVTPRDRALLSNNLNLVVLLNSQNTAQTRPAVIAEKPVENSKSASQKTPTLEDFLEELEDLLNEMQDLSSESAEAVDEDREKAQDSQLLRKLKKLKLAWFIKQQLDRKDPCNAEKDIQQRLEKMKALRDNLQATKLETSDVNEALMWLKNNIEALAKAEKEAADRCTRFKRTFGTVN